MTVPSTRGRDPGRLEKRVVGAMVKRLFLRGRRGGPWDLPDGLTGAPLQLRGNSGARIAALHFAHPSPRGIVVLAHPDRRYGKHWFVREGWIGWLLENGFDAVTFDFAAYGASRGGSTYFHDDIVAAVDAARKLRPGLPLHLVGLSIGAFASINASVRIPDLESLVLESPYPTFDAWYAESRSARALGKLNGAMGKVWPRTYRRIDAGRNARDVTAKRILVAASPRDTVTPIALSSAVHAALPSGARWLEVDAEHLHLFGDGDYRAAILETLAPGGPSPKGAVNLISHLA